MADEIPKPASERWTTLVCVVFVVSIPLIAINLATATRSPRVWLDEGQFADPAINLLEGRGFVTTAWEYPANTFFAGNSPGYSLCLAGWMSIFGKSIQAVRSLNIVLMGFVAVTLFAALWRFGLCRGRFQTAAMTCLIFCGYGMAFSYRGARYDVLGVWMASLLFLLISFEARARILGCVAVVASLMPWVGLQLIPLCVIFSGAGFLLMKKRFLPFFLAMAIGGAVGLGAMLGMFAHFGVLQDFRSSVNSLSAGMKGLSPRLLGVVTGVKNDFSSLLLLAANLLILIFASGRARRIASLGMIFGIVIPAMVGFSGKFPIYYAWMKFIPLVATTVALLDTGKERLPTVLRYVTIGAIALACLGLPGRFVKMAKDWRVNDHGALSAGIASKLDENTSAIVSTQFYFATRPYVREIATVTWLSHAKPEELEKIDAMVVAPTDAAKVQKAVGGKWESRGMYFPPGITQVSDNPFTGAYYVAEVFQRSAP